MYFSDLSNNAKNNFLVSYTNCVATGSIAGKEIKEIGTLLYAFIVGEISADQFADDASDYDCMADLVEALRPGG